MSKVYSIVRVSSVGQSDNTSLEHQKDTITKYCDLYDLELQEIIEEVYTGTTEDRDGLNYLMNKVKSGECDTIVVYKIDRLMRSFRGGINFIGDLMEHGCKIISTQEQIDTSSISGKFFMNILLSMSEMEKSTITQRLVRGKRHRFMNDKKLVCSSPCFGYKKVSGDIVVDENNSKIVKLVFKLWNKWIDLDSHIRTRKITKYLNDRGYTFNGNRFHRIHIRRIVRNTFYKGTMTFGKMKTNHNYPTLISTRLWNKVHSSYQ
tara:strand:+ start:9408 stop:10193 length:786 start_codon:yes stop_codon:yes gene_type:complete